MTPLNKFESAALDRWLTAAPDDHWSSEERLHESFITSIDDLHSDQHKQHLKEYDFEGSETELKWLEKLFEQALQNDCVEDQEHLEHAAQVIERCFERYILHDIKTEFDEDGYDISYCQKCCQSVDLLMLNNLFICT